MKSQINPETLTNQCPCCKTVGSLVLHVEAMDTNYEEDEDGWDTYVDIPLDNDLAVIKKRLPRGIVTCDKDRYVKCTECCVDSSYKEELKPYRTKVKDLNPGWV